MTPGVEYQWHALRDEHLLIVRRHGQRERPALDLPALLLLGALAVPDDDIARVVAADKQLVVAAQRQAVDPVAVCFEGAGRRLLLDRGVERRRHFGAAVLARLGVLNGAG